MTFNNHPLSLSINFSQYLATALYIRDIIKDAVSDFMDLACSKARTVDQCKQVLPELTTMFETKLEEGVDRQNTSALFPFLQIAIKFDY